VRGVEAVECAGHDGGHDARRDGASACEARERLSLHVIHHEKELTPRGDDVERAHHVRVANSSGKPRLVEEHRDELGIFRVLRVEALDRYRAREANRPEEPAEVYSGHPTRGDLAVERIATNYMGWISHWEPAYQIWLELSRRDCIDALFLLL